MEESSWRRATEGATSKKDSLLVGVRRGPSTLSEARKQIRPHQASRDALHEDPRSDSLKDSASLPEDHESVLIVRLEVVVKLRKWVPKQNQKEKSSQQLMNIMKTSMH